jgi:hypothetical protein
VPIAGGSGSHQGGQVLTVGGSGARSRELFAHCGGSWQILLVWIPFNSRKKGFMRWMTWWAISA